MTQNISFHDAGLLDIKQDEDSLVFHAEGVATDSGEHNATVYINGLSSMERDHEPFSLFTVEHSDGEIISFKWTESTASLLIEWRDFSPKLKVTRFYEFAFESIKIELSELSPDWGQS